MIQAASIAELISMFSVGRSNAAMSISHLLFAYDAITFCDSNCEQMVNLHCVLTWFETGSSLRVNQELAFTDYQLPVEEVDNCFRMQH